ncbi:MAG: hypothetical protein K6A65_08610, partial [Succinivibrionaceae bacterium]|nr:hypothetical protein [Succinivibrionaceae bacterium]
MVRTIGVVKLALARLMAVALLLLCPALPAWAAGLPEWNIMLYLDGDNDLELAALADLLEIEHALPGNVEVIALVDRSIEHNSKVFGGWTGTRLYRLRRGNYPDIDEIRKVRTDQYPPQPAAELLEDWGEADMADPATLERFIRRAARFPAKRYALVPWDHGGGWISMLSDNDGGQGKPGNTYMSSDDFARAAANASAVLPRKRFDLVVFDMCLMGQLDVMSSASLYADYAIACPPVQPGEGTDYLKVMPIYGQGLGTAETARAIVKANVDFYVDLGKQAAFTAFDLSKIPMVCSQLKQLSGILTGLVPSEGMSLNRALWYAAKLTNQDEALRKRDTPAFAAVSLRDFLDRVDTEVPGAPKGLIASIRASVDSMIIATGSTPGYDACEGVSIYMPMLVGMLHPDYYKTYFTQLSGLSSWLVAMYNFQGKFKSSALRVSKIELGRAVLNADGGYSTPEEIKVKKRRTIVPFNRDVVRFEVDGTGVVGAQLAEFSKAGNQLIMHYRQPLIDEDARDVEGANVNNLTAALSPRFRDGKTTLVREITGVRFVVVSGNQGAPITIITEGVNRALQDNVSYGYGRYTDPQLNGQQVDVVIKFSNVLHSAISAEADVTDASGRIIGRREVELRDGGTFWPGLITVDGKTGRQGLVYGKPMTLSDSLYVTLDMIPEGTQFGVAVIAQNIMGKTAGAVSGTATIKHDKAQVQMLRNAIARVNQDLPGTYAMVQLRLEGNRELLELPTFQTMTFSPPHGRATSRWAFDNGTTRREGPLRWVDGGLPQLEIHEESDRKYIRYGGTIQSWYPFLKGSGPDRVWYCIGMGDGTRWALYPIEQYRGQPQGTFTSKNERWVFEGGKVTYTRLGKTYTGTFTVKGNIFTATGLPQDRYSFHYNHKNGDLTIKGMGKLTSILHREGKNPVSAAPQPQPQPQPQP